MRRVRIATRGSALAVAQSGHVAWALQATLGVETELVEVRTSGDRIQDVPLSQLGGKGLFVKEIEEALLDGRAELAVHSAKDLPAACAAGLVLAAFPERADARDALVGRSDGTSLATLRQGARVGTGSVRRASQLRAIRPDLEIVALRGNVDTRLAKLERDGLDAVVLACAGLERLGLGDRIHERIAVDRLLPAVGQGALALQVHADSSLVSELAAIDHAPTHVAIRAERAFQARLEGDCDVPLAALCEPDGSGRLRIRGRVLSPDGKVVAEAEVIAAIDDAELAGRRAGEDVLAAGGAEILAALGARRP